MHLPPGEKIYDEDAVPDYDMYSSDPWKDAVELANILYRKGFKYTEVRAGIHRGTYKVYANLWPVADITYMPHQLFNRLDVKKFRGLPVASADRLMENMYKELANPHDDPSRLLKVVTRQKLLEKWTNPIPQDLRCSKDIFARKNIKINPMLVRLLEIAGRYIEKRKLIHVGALAYNTYMEIGGAPQRVTVKNYKVVSEFAHSDVQKLMTKLLHEYKRLNILTTVKLESAFNQTSYSIIAMLPEDLNKTSRDWVRTREEEDEGLAFVAHPVCVIFQSTECTPYKYILGRYVASIDYLKYIMYTNLVFSPKNVSRDWRCKIKYLNKVQKLYYRDKNVSETDESPFQRFVINCKGPTKHNLKQEILRRWIDNVERKKKGYPKDPIPEKCQGARQSECNYPCLWRNKKCVGIPRGVYRAGPN
jgi:hypothetical protein